MSKRKNKQTTYEKIELFFEKRRKLFFYLSVILTVIFSVLVFDFKVSTGGDDSTYILAAKRFIDGKAFPSWHGSFYPLFLSFFLKIFGLNLILFKVLSFLMILFHIILFYLTFKKRVSWIVLFLTMLYLSVCLEIVYFAGQTYSEAMFLLLQILVFNIFYKIYDSKNKKFLGDKSKWLMFGFTLFLTVITRNIGWVMLFSALGYFVIQKQFKYSIKTFLSFLVFYIPYYIYKIIFWKASGVGFEGQLGKMFWINPYNKNDGMETLGGFLHRFLINSENYLSAHLPNIFSWFVVAKTSILLTIVFYVFLLFIGFVVFKKSKQLLFPYIYLVLGLLATFISQQIMWNQLRLILIFVPLFVLLFAESLRLFFEKYKSKILKSLFAIFLLSIIIPSVVKTVKISKRHAPVLKANLAGNKFYGYTKDWRNYLKMTEWVSENIPKKSIVACRKPGMAFIYGKGRDFYGIYTVKSYQVDEVFNKLQKETSTYHVFVDIKAEGKKCYALYPFFYYISIIVNKSDGHQFLEFSLDNENIKPFFSLVTKAGIKPMNLKQMKSIFTKKEKNDYVVYPDTLLNFIQKNDIDYLIAAHLRKYSQHKTSEFISTIHRYIYFIELKYPGAFKVVYQIGKKGDENAILVKVDTIKTKLYPPRIKKN